VTSSARGLFLTAPGQMELRAFEPPEPGPGQVRVRVAGCGVCHTDVTFASGAVRPHHPLPLILGHEVAGVVEAAAPGTEALLGRAVIVPAVWPCGRCDLCQAGRDTACQAQVMPGNHVHGGFATHLIAPADLLVPVDEGVEPPDGRHLAELAVIADAVTTPYQALRRAGVEPGDLVIVIGIGGIGTFGVQIAHALGALVAAVDIDPAKLDRAAHLGAPWTFNPTETDGRTIKQRLLAASGVSTARWRIFEMSGTAAGQELAWSLLPPAGTLAVVGFTMDRPAIRLSNLMALDATAFGTWGCSPRWYPAVVELVQSGRIDVRSFVELHPLEDGIALVTGGAHHAPARRPVLVPQM
jgi:6-hydroxycyclohex-1-ene-1-carbonyl-CoA dehydrogenase